MENPPTETLTEFDEPAEKWADRKLAQIMRNSAIMLQKIGDFDELGDEDLERIVKLSIELESEVQNQVSDTHQDYFGTLHSAFEMALSSFELDQISDLFKRIRVVSESEEQGGIVEELAHLSARLDDNSIIGQSENEGPNSDNWHFAKIVTLYLLGLRSTDEKGWRKAEIGYQIGFLFRDEWWKTNHEEAALSYYSNVRSAREASKKGGRTTSSAYLRRKEKVLELIPTALKEKGTPFAFADLKIRATTLREIALREAPNEFISPQNKPLSIDWFLRALEDFQADGRLHEALKNALEA